MIRSRLRRNLLAIVGALALLATACGGSDAAVEAANTADAEAPAPAAAEEAPAAEADSAPAISLTASTISGGQIDFASLEGQDVVLWFWAPW